MHITKDDKVKILYKNNENVIEEISNYVVDARGRFTPYKDEYITGPKSFSLLQKLEINEVIEPRLLIQFKMGKFGKHT
ncbi:hypothetical protein [Arcobacter sp. CECT 8985]|uniref:hypothetical protein n=1 Tax=Arcobacter sp. CECT 8985 TaxID=1935424 RepID=UPI00100BF631|nr:hypothetical protein [Arcobacter sp. CECT 8985]RXJ83507.1 hypothetical protein CRU93_13765 [Arcobacter sp. CECT 8985]